MKKIFITLMFVYILSICYLENIKYKIKGVRENIYRNISGIWVRIPNDEYNQIEKFSWGYSRLPKVNTIPPTYLEIDLNNQNSPFYFDNSAAYENGKREIIEVIEIQKNKYKLLLKSIDGEFNDKDVIVIEYIENKKIRIHEAPNESFQLGFFFKFGGPDIPFDDYYKPKMDNIKFYYDGGIGKTYKELFLTKNEKIVILTNLGEDKINGILGQWVFIQIVESNKHGYCLIEDLEPYKKNNKKKENLKIQYHTPTIQNLRFRETPTLDGKFIRMLKQGEKLELIEKGKTETIGNVKGTWIKVRTEKGEIGWCFDAYLKKEK